MGRVRSPASTPLSAGFRSRALAGCRLSIRVRRRLPEPVRSPATARTGLPDHPACRRGRPNERTVSEGLRRGLAVDVCRSLGVDEIQAVHIPYGLKHDKYRVVSPIEHRPSQVAMSYNSHPTKGPREGLRALARVKRRTPDAEIIVFGGSDPDARDSRRNHLHDVPASGDDRRADLQPQPRLPQLEPGGGVSGCPASKRWPAAVRWLRPTTAARAITPCTTRPRSSLREGDARMFAGNIERLLRGDGERLRLARAGMRFVGRYDWDESGRLVRGVPRDLRSRSVPLPGVRGRLAWVLRADGRRR